MSYIQQKTLVIHVAHLQIIKSNNKLSKVK